MIVDYGRDAMGQFWANQAIKGVDRRPREGEAMTDTARDFIQDAVDAETVCECGHYERSHKHLEECREGECRCPIYRPQEEDA